MNAHFRVTGAILCAACTLVACESTRRTSSIDVAEAQSWNHYGGAVNLAAVREPLRIDHLKGGEQDVVVAAEIVDICAVKGCWMNVRSESGRQIFVKFKDYGFFVPRDAAGHTVVMHGNAIRETESVERLRHYAYDAGKSPAEIAQITEPRTRITFVADAIYVEGENLQRPYPETPVNNPDPGYVCD